MKTNFFAPLLIVSLTMILFGCDVDKTQEGKMPDIDIQSSGGQLPKYDVDAPDVDVNSKEVEVEVPDVDVKTEKKTITVPDVDVDMP